MAGTRLEADRPRSPLNLIYEHSVQDSFEEFKEEMAKAMLFPKKPQMRSWCIRKAIETFGDAGLYVEFGVFTGGAINLFAKELQPSGLRITGFDSFVGLSEDWVGNQNGRPAGSYSLQGNLPDVDDNVELKVGWVEDTLPAFLDENDGTIAFAHMDLDTYSPTAFALGEIKTRLVPGSIVLFDELYGYPGWRHHEFKALKEVLPDETYEFIGFSNQSVGIRML